MAVAIYAFVVLRNSEDIKTNIKKVYEHDIFNNYYAKPEDAEIVNDIQSAVSFENYALASFDSSTKSYLCNIK